MKNVYIQPAMGDAGLVIGAVYAFLSKKNKVKPRFLNTVSLGTDYKKNEIRDILNKKILNLIISKIFQIH